MLSKYHISLLVTCLQTCLLATALPSSGDKSQYSLKEHHRLPHGWKSLGPAPKDKLLYLQVGLKQNDFAGLERHLYQVSDPSHARYGQHLSAAEVHKLIRPTEDTSIMVHDWLTMNGIESQELQYSPAGDWINFFLLVRQADGLLRTEYHVFEHDDGTQMIRTSNWSLPNHLHDHIDAIQPTNSFLRAMPQGLTAMPVQAIDDMSAVSALAEHGDPDKITVSEACNSSFVTPLCLRTLYGTASYKPQVPGRNRIGLIDYLGEANNRSDVAIYLKKFRPEAAKSAYNFKVEVIAGGDDQQTPDNATQLKRYKDVEGNLDTETILGISYPTSLTAYTTGGSPPFRPDLKDPVNGNEPYLAWLNYVLAQESVPQVISTSYADDEETVPPSYAKRVCNDLAQLGARGVSLLFGSGDFGVGKTGTCQTNDGKNQSTFVPSFPAGCPYTTVVGATKGFNPEVVAFDAMPPTANSGNFASGGGFSNYFSRPSYQDGVVDKYVRNLGSDFRGLYNKDGRGYPDISAQGQRFATVWNGSILILDGTSCATPTAAAIISLYNDALIAKGRPPLGFLNPWLYRRGNLAFNDVTSGSAVGCGVDGFPANAGWDAVSGFGTPDFKRLRKL